MQLDYTFICSISAKHNFYYTVYTDIAHIHIYNYKLTTHH